MARVVSFKNKFILSEVNGYSSINVPLKTTGRIKYTCFDVSHSFLVFGATSGGLYLFKRDPCTFIQLLPNKEGPVTSVSISPDEKLFAFASQRGIACVLERSEGASTRLLNRSTEHSGVRITALQWVNTSDQIFIGDSIGRLSVINVSLFLSKNIFQIPSFIFMQLDSGIVQISCRDDRLLVSTLTHCYVCDTAKEQYRQIGTKSRDGEYGACYLSDKIFCARPGSRLWEVDLEGSVQNTHQFKQLLAIRPEILVTESELIRDGVCEDGDCKKDDANDCWSEQSFNFMKLSPILKFILTFKKDGIYIFDPENVNVVLWNNYFKNIINVVCLDNCIYVWTEARKLHVVMLVTLEKCLLRLFFTEKYRLCYDVLNYFSNDLLCSLESNYGLELLFNLQPIVDLRDHIDCSDSVIKVLDRIEDVLKNKETAVKLESGIFRIDNHHSVNGTSELRNGEARVSDNIENDCIKNPAQVNSLTDISSASDQSVLPELIRMSDKLGTTHRQYSYARMANGVYSVPQIPFLPLSSPDIIHDALIEIGYNVSGKFVNGTKTLKDKWQVLEGKLKLSTNKSDGNHKRSDSRCTNEVCHNDEASGLTNGDIANGEHFDRNLVDKDEDPIVINRCAVSNKPNVQKYIPSELLNICCNLEQSNSVLEFTVLSNLLTVVLQSYKHYMDFIIESNNNLSQVSGVDASFMASSSTSPGTNEVLPESNKADKTNKPDYRISDVKYFPFSQFLPDNQVNMLKNILHDKLRSNDVIKWLNVNKNCPIVQEVLLNSSDILLLKGNTHPGVLAKAYSEDVLYIDLLLSKLLIIFSEVIDPYSILQIISALELDCTYLSWCVIMDRFQEGALSYFSRRNGDIDSKSENLNIGCKDWPLPLLLNAMFLMLCLDQVDPMIKMGNEGNVSSSTISYIMLKLSRHLEESAAMDQSEASRKCANLFLLYLSKIVSQSKTCDVIDYDNIGLISHIEESFILVNKDLNYDICSCGFPKMNVKKRKISQNYRAQKLLSYEKSQHMRKHDTSCDITLPLNASNSSSSQVNSRSDTVLTNDDISPKLLVNRSMSYNIKYPNIGEMLLNYFWDSKIKPDLISTHVSSDSERNDENFWSLLGNIDGGHIPSNEYLEHAKRICTVAPHLLLWLLKNKIKRDLFTVRTALILQLGYLHEFSCNDALGVDKWEQIVELNCKIEKGECCVCSQKYEPVPGINWSQLATIILKTIGPKSALMILKKYTSDLPHGVINKRFYQACMLTSYVESRVKDSNKAEKVISAVNYVTDDSCSTVSTAVASSESQAGQDLARAIALDVLTESDRMVSKLVNAENHHWGTTLDLENGCCNLCSLSLGAPCLLLDTGLRIFKCGHGFHSVCLSVKQTLKNCPVCSR